MPVQSTLYLLGILDDVVFKDLLGQQLVQACVLCPKVIQAPGIGQADAGELAAPKIPGRLAEAMWAAELLDRHAGPGFAQQADGLFFGALLNGTV